MEPWHLNLHLLDHAGRRQEGWRWFCDYIFLCLKAYRMKYAFVCFLSIIWCTMPRGYLFPPNDFSCFNAWTKAFCGPLTEASNLNTKLRYQWQTWNEAAVSRTHLTKMKMPFQWEEEQLYSLRKWNTTGGAWKSPQGFGCGLSPSSAFHWLYEFRQYI